MIGSSVLYMTIHSNCWYTITKQQGLPAQLLLLLLLLLVLGVSYLTTYTI